MATLKEELKATGNMIENPPYKFTIIEKSKGKTVMLRVQGVCLFIPYDKLKRVVTELEKDQAKYNNK